MIKKLMLMDIPVGVPNAGVAQATDGCGAYIIDLQTLKLKN